MTVWMQLLRKWKPHNVSRVATTHRYGDGVYSACMFCCITLHALFYFFSYFILILYITPVFCVVDIWSAHKCGVNLIFY